MSMAAGEYVSVSSQADTENADLERERQELATEPEREHAEMAAIYVKRGLDAPLAAQVATQLMSHDALGTHARDELGISEIMSARPLQAAWTSAATIPRGVRAGQHIRLVGQGMPGAGQGKAGDLYLEISFHPHALYRVDQRDVYLDLPVSPWEAALGASVKVPTPSGVVELKVPANSLSGGKLRLKGRGIPSTTMPGNFYAVLQMALPPADNETASNFYKNMAEQFSTFNPRVGLGESV